MTHWRDNNIKAWLEPLRNISLLLKGDMNEGTSLAYSSEQCHIDEGWWYLDCGSHFVTMRVAGWWHRWPAHNGRTETWKQAGPLRMLPCCEVKQLQSGPTTRVLIMVSYIAILLFKPIEIYFLLLVAKALQETIRLFVFFDIIIYFGEDISK